MTKAPITTNTTTCPKGVLGNCGPINPSELKWRSVVEIGDTDPPGYYTNPPTFGQANQEDPKCNAGKVDSDW